MGIQSGWINHNESAPVEAGSWKWTPVTVSILQLAATSWLIKEGHLVCGTWGEGLAADNSAMVYTPSEDRERETYHQLTSICRQLEIHFPSSVDEITLPVLCFSSNALFTLCVFHICLLSILLAYTNIFKSYLQLFLFLFFVCWYNRFTSAILLGLYLFFFISLSTVPYCAQNTQQCLILSPMKGKIFLITHTKKPWYISHNG